MCILQDVLQHDERWNWSSPPGGCHELMLSTHWTELPPFITSSSFVPHFQQFWSTFTELLHICFWWRHLTVPGGKYTRQSLAMHMYTLATVSLFRSLPDPVTQVWYADDATALCTVSQLPVWWTGPTRDQRGLEEKVSSPRSAPKMFN